MRLFEMAFFFWRKKKMPKVSSGFFSCCWRKRRNFHDRHVELRSCVAAAAYSQQVTMHFLARRPNDEKRETRRIYFYTRARGGEEHVCHTLRAARALKKTTNKRASSERGKKLVKTKGSSVRGGWMHWARAVKGGTLLRGHITTTTSTSAPATPPPTDAIIYPYPYNLITIAQYLTKIKPHHFFHTLFLPFFLLLFLSSFHRVRGSWTCLYMARLSERNLFCGWRIIEPRIAPNQQSRGARELKIFENFEQVLTLDNKSVYLPIYILCFSRPKYCHNIFIFSPTYYEMYLLWRVLLITLPSAMQKMPILVEGWRKEYSALANVGQPTFETCAVTAAYTILLLNEPCATFDKCCSPINFHQPSPKYYNCRERNVERWLKAISCFREREKE